MSTQRTTSISDQKQSGMVAIMVTMILMIVIGLIVIGFAQVSRRNQRQALDRQLSTQAFYAAESGVNDAVERIKTALAGGTAVSAKPDCASTGGGFYTADPNIDSTNKVAYTCLTVNPTPPSLVYGDINATGTVVPLIASNGTVSSLTLTWKPKAGVTTPVTSCPANATTLPSTANWTCPYGVLRFDLVPTAGAALSLNGLQTSAMTSFVVPLRPGSTGTANPIGYTTGGGNNRLSVVCSATSCSLTINGLSQSQYYMRVSSVYNSVSLEVTGTNAGGTAVSFQGAQAIVDATGKAQDVLRRVQVRVPLIGSSTNQLSDFAIHSSESICKRFSVMDGFFQSSAGAAVPGVSTSTTNPLCQ